MSMQTFNIGDNIQVMVELSNSIDTDYLLSDIIDNEEYKIYNSGDSTIGENVGHLSNLITKLLGDYTVLKFVKLQ